MASQSINTDVCVVGGGPCGMMTGFLLAHQGLDVVVLEKHKDFFRDFRGDTIHPSTMEILKELGILDDFLKVPHDKVKKVEADFGNKRIVLADFSHVPTHEKYIAFMPQWDFLNFISKKAKELNNFHLLMQTEFTNLIEENRKVRGIKARGPNGTFEINSRLTIAADGRHSDVREVAGLKAVEIGVPIDVLWFRISREKEDPKSVLARVNKGQMMVMLDRMTYWQCAYVIPKNGFEKIRKEGLLNFQSNLKATAPFLGERVLEVVSFNDIKLLTVAVNHLKKWYKNGVLFIGDSAHAMSPVGGVGVNLAIADAVATSNILGPILKEREVTVEDLKKVQTRREFPTKVIQKIQVFVQNRLIKEFINTKKETKPPFIFSLMHNFSYLRRFPARIICLGVRAEHVNV